mmetsp:Transcript_3738/g.10153  ORF Transcript_3738/g.10153 Transcript_3738/m.10153 type:complete len:92 (-) Transcript_3738:70-345(-)
MHACSEAHSNTTPPTPQELEAALDNNINIILLVKEGSRLVFADESTTWYPCASMHPSDVLASEWMRRVCLYTLMILCCFGTPYPPFWCYFD